MKVLNTDLWSTSTHPNILIAVTTNGSISRYGLVMGRGAAYEATQRYQGLRIAARNEIVLNEFFDAHRQAYVYGFRHVGGLKPKGNHRRSQIGLFQVKYRYDERADLALIGLSVARLNTWLGNNAQVDEVHLNFPGIGHGGRQRSEVEPILRSLNANVILHVK